MLRCLQMRQDVTSMLSQARLSDDRQCSWFEVLHAHVKAHLYRAMLVLARSSMCLHGCIGTHLCSVITGLLHQAQHMPAGLRSHSRLSSDLAPVRCSWDAMAYAMHAGTQTFYAAVFATLQLLQVVGCLEGSLPVDGQTWPLPAQQRDCPACVQLLEVRQADCALRAASPCA